MRRLAPWQDSFAAALRSTAPLSPEAAHPAFAVYRNTVWKGWIDAIEANFPAVAALTGPDWMRAGAGAYAQGHAPSLPMLSLYGADFPDFLIDFPPAADLPYLPAVARLDRAWTEAHLAADAAPLDATALATLTPDAMGRRVAQPHPSLRVLWFEATIPTLWLANRDDFDGGALALDDRSEGLLLVRPGETVEAMILDRATHAFVAACQGERPLLDAAAAALTADPTCDMGDILARLFGFGVFAGLSNP